MGQTEPVLEILGSLGGRIKGFTNTETGLHPPFSNQTKSVKISDHHKLTCKSPQALLPGGGIASAIEFVKECQESLGFYNRLFLVLKPNNK